MAHRHLGKILVEHGAITQAQLNTALAEQKTSGEVLGQILISHGVATVDEVMEALAEQANVPKIDLADYPVQSDAVNMIPRVQAEFHEILPLRIEDGVLTVAMADPLNLQTLDDLRLMLNCELDPAYSPKSQIEAAIEKYYGPKEVTVSALLKQMLESDQFVGEVADADLAEEELSAEDLRKMAEEGPVVRLLDLVLIQSLQDRASDIHFEPFEDDYKVRYRLDGVMYELVHPPRPMHLAVASRIKVLANLDIAERRLPQDGRIRMKLAGRDVDLRVSCLPTMFGESIVLRVLDQSVVGLNLEQVGLNEKDHRIVEKLIDKPHGIILVTGPTGSGKTTTLYAMIRDLNQIGVKIITTEDPVEYHVTGIMQINIKEEIGLTFARCLRSILRQDPDIVLVGEIRDFETGQIAIQASLTGHIVLSTLHTNDAPSTLTRLIDMGLEPFLLTSTIEGIIAQRLVRVLCVHCKKPYEPTPEDMAAMNITPEDLESATVCTSVGCPACNNIGFRGRTGIFELMALDNELRELIVGKSSTGVLRHMAIQHGMITLKESGKEKILLGVTAIPEVVRATMT